MVGDSVSLVAFWRFRPAPLLLWLGLLLDGADDAGVAFAEFSLHEEVLDLGFLWRKLGRFQPLEVEASLGGSVSSLMLSLMLLSSLSPILVLSKSGIGWSGSSAPKDWPMFS